ncbi:MAG: VOC family protein [Gammaproteobacteria bacterium]|jgi:lactoylglutathione lyase
MAKIIHTMIRVLDLDKSIGFYRDALGLELSNRLDFDDFSLVYLRNPENDVELELTWNRDQTEPYTHGTGYGHIAVTVDDLETEHARFKTAGYEPRDIMSLSSEDKEAAKFFFMKDPDGYEIEFIQKHGHYQ